jgi:hypothetical protein
MKTRIFFLVAICGLVLLSFLSGYLSGRGKSQKNLTLLPSYGNSTLCMSLEPGVSIREVVLALGSPIGAKGDYMLFTPTPIGNSIKVKADLASGEVLELFCDSPEKPTWTRVPSVKTR